MKPLPIQETATENLSDLAYKRLLNLILNGQLPAGSAILERAIAQWLEISRTPVRQALARLENEGLIERKANRLLVKEVGLDEFVEILSTRQLLEAEAARLAASRGVNKIELLELRAETLTLTEQAEITSSEHQKLDDRFHSLIAEACGNRILRDMIQHLRRKTRCFGHERLPERSKPGCLEHLAVLDAIEQGEADRAAAAMGKHIESVRKSITDHLKI